MWDKKIDSPLQSKIPETFFNSLLNGKSDPLGNFSKASFLDRVICQITQEWSLQKLFSKCNTALQWDFFLVLASWRNCTSPPHLGVTVLQTKWSSDSSAESYTLRACLANTKRCWEKSVVLLGFLTFVSTLLTTGCQQGVWGAGGPGETLAPCPGEQNNQGRDGNGWSSQQGKASNTAQLFPQWAQFPWWGQQATSIPWELVSAELCCSSSQI